MPRFMPARGSLFVFRSLSFRLTFLPLLRFVDFIVIFFLVLAFRDFSSLRTHFWPFIEVLSEIQPEVTPNFWRTVEA